MDRGKLNPSLVLGNEIETYLYFVSLHLSGEIKESDLPQISPILRTLIRIRSFLRAQNYPTALEALKLLHPTLHEPFHLAEYYFLSGHVCYCQENFEEALNHFEESAGAYSRSGYIKKALLAQFNRCQSLVSLGRWDEASHLERELLSLAQEQEMDSLMGLLCRAHGYQALRIHDFETASSFFKKSNLYLLKENNHSDADLAFLYYVLAELGAERGYSLGASVKTIVERAPNERISHFAKYLLSVITDTDYEAIKQLFKNCDRDQRAAIEMALPMFTHCGRAKTKMKLSDQLLSILRENGPMDKQNCIEQLWQTKKATPSLVIRFHTLVSRINKMTKVVFLNENGQYFIN